MKLIIVESPNKCGKIKGFLGSEYIVTASVGHIREIPKKGLNIDIKNGFEPTYEISPDKKSVVKEIKELAKKADKIYLASDPDREGSAIAFSIYEILDEKSKKKCVRIMFNEITKAAVLRAIGEETTIQSHMPLIQAAKARQVLDRLIGYRVSPAVWRYVAPKTSAGRVQSVALRIICDRQREIEAFKPNDYWFVEALLKNKNGEFWAKVVTKDKDNKYADEKIAKDDLEKIKTASFTVDKLEKTTKENKAYPPFDTTSMQSSASSLFGWSATKTNQNAQSLYVSGKVSYIRTDSYNISEEAMTEVRKHVKDNLGDKYLPAKANIYIKKSGAASQEAHECIRPSHVEDTGDDIDDSDNKKLYKLIRDRFIACQMNPMVVDVVNCMVKASSKHELVAKGQSIKFDGWFKVYKYAKFDEETLPEMTQGEKLDLKDSKCTKHTTKPPARYNDGSLIKKMEADGVGRPSTRAQIIKNIQDKGYVEKAKEKPGGFVATILGVKICDYLVPAFKDFFMDIKYTSSLEDSLDEIANGKKTYLDVLQSVYDVLQQHLKDSKDNMPERKEAVKMGAKCPVCKKGDIVEKDGKFGKFYSCDQYPKCKTILNKGEDGEFTAKKPSTAKKTGRKCPECEKKGRDGDLLERKNRVSGSAFLACNKYPTCRYTESVDGEKGKKSYTKKEVEEDSEPEKTEKDDFGLE